MSVHLPLRMETSDGVVLEKGDYKVEIRIETARHLLFLFTDGKQVAVVNGQIAGNEPYRPEANPVCGTVYLHPADETIGTEEDRRQGKTGKTLYEAESRDWGQL